MHRVGIDSDDFEITSLVEAQQTIMRTHARMLAAELRGCAKDVAHPVHARLEIGCCHYDVINRCFVSHT